LKRASPLKKQTTGSDSFIIVKFSAVISAPNELSGETIVIIKRIEQQICIRLFMMTPITLSFLSIFNLAC
jgi:hypothetical protein